MQLPIDFTKTNFPIKEKYIDDETAELSRWMIFGRYDDCTVAVCDSQGDALLGRLNGKRAFPGRPPC